MSSDKKSLHQRRKRSRLDKDRRVPQTLDPQCIVGRNACLALFQSRPADIQKVTISRKCRSHFPDLEEFCCQTNRPIKFSDDVELERIAAGKHHEGIAILAVPRRQLTLNEVLRAKPAAALLLDGVGNPHNVGAIIRVCGFYGVTALFIAEHGAPQLSSAAIRIAEGAAEFVGVVFVDSAATCLNRLTEEGFTPVTTSPRAKLHLADLPRIQRPVYVFGAEGSGLSNDILKTGHHEVSLPGSGKVESLNVACSVAVVLSDYWNKK